MNFTAAVLVALVALLHLGIAWMEMFAWTRVGPKVFKSLPKNLFAPTRAMAANQGLYNAFLSAGLIWSLLIGQVDWQVNVATCFLLFVIVAGAYGAATVSKTILLVQTAPAVVALLALHLW